jgi:hypothetical protein
VPRHLDRLGHVAEHLADIRLTTAPKMPVSSAVGIPVLLSMILPPGT